MTGKQWEDEEGEQLELVCRVLLKEPDQFIT